MKRINVGTSDYCLVFGCQNPIETDNQDHLCDFHIQETLERRREANRPNKTGIEAYTKKELITLVKRLTQELKKKNTTA